jgi:hypothetical protein
MSKKLGIVCPKCGGTTRVNRTDTRVGTVYRYRKCDDGSFGGKVVSTEVQGAKYFPISAISGIVVLDQPETD